MKIVHALTGTLLCCFLASAFISVAQTKNAATDKQRQENLDKLQKKQAKQKAAYNNMSEEQKAVARAKANERKTGKTGGSTPVKPTTAKSGSVKQQGNVNTKPAIKPAPVKVMPMSKTGVNANPSKVVIKTGTQQTPAVKKTKATPIKATPKNTKPAIQPAKKVTSSDKVKK